jgi:glutaredoxin-related protein
LCKSEKYMKIHCLEVNNTKMIIGYDFFMFKYPIKC